MSRLQGLKAFISQRLSEAVEDILGHLEKTIVEYEEETERRHRDFLDVVLTAEMRQKAAADFRHPSMRENAEPPEQQEEKSFSQDQGQHDPIPLYIKEEQEESEINKFTFHPVLVKKEDDNETPQFLAPQQNCVEETVIILDDDDQDELEFKSELKKEANIQPYRLSEQPDSDINKEIPMTDFECNSWNSFWCSECGKRFSSLNFLNLHMRCHMSDRPYKCLVCRKGFSSRGRLQKHMRTHTGERPFKCSVCGKRFSESGNLKVHMRLHTGEKPFSCSVCGKGYAQRGNLKMHMAAHRRDASSNSTREQFQDGHKDGAPQLTTDSGKHVTCDGFGNIGDSGSCMGCSVCKKILSCSECGKKFSFQGQLRAHMRTHTGERPFQCPVCWKSFSWNGCLQKHMKIHTGEKPYRCTVCGKGFIEGGNLKVHMRIHTGEMPFSCTVCSKLYRQKGNLTKHMEVHREGK